MLHCLDGGGCLGHLWSQEMLLCVMLDGAAGSQRHTPAPPGGSLPSPPPHTKEISRKYIVQSGSNLGCMRVGRGTGTGQ